MVLIIGAGGGSIGASSSSADDDGSDLSKEVDESIKTGSARLALLRPGLGSSSSAPSLRRQGEQRLLGNPISSCGFASGRETEIMKCYGPPAKSPRRRGCCRTRDLCSNKGQGHGLSLAELRHIAIGRQPSLPYNNANPAADAIGTGDDKKCREMLQNTRASLRALRRASHGPLFEALFRRRRAPTATIEEDLSDSDRDFSEGGGVTHANLEERWQTSLLENEDDVVGGGELRPPKATTGASRQNARRSPFVEYEAREKRLIDERKWLQEDAHYMSQRKSALRHDMIQKNLAQQNLNMVEAYDNSIFYTDYALRLRTSNRRHGTSAHGGSGMLQHQQSIARTRTRTMSFITKSPRSHEVQDKKEGEAIAKVKKMQQDLKVILQQSFSTEGDAPNLLRNQSQGPASARAPQVAWAAT